MKTNNKNLKKQLCLGAIVRNTRDLIITEDLIRDSEITNTPKPKKSLGQYFLINKKALITTREALAATAKETVIEIGAGHGELTDLLITTPAQKIITIEKDHELAEQLKEKYKDVSPRVDVVEGDALKDLAPLINRLYPHTSQGVRGYILTGNIPYYITGYLLRIIGDLEHKPLRTVLTMQKEVAERICALPPHNNRLAACVQIWGTPKIVIQLTPNDFNPPPAVDSAIIVIETKKDLLKDDALANYYETVGILFQQPRKTILNNLADGFDMPKEKALALLAQAGLTGTERPENLTIEIIKKISKLTH